MGHQRQGAHRVQVRQLQVSLAGANEVNRGSETGKQRHLERYKVTPVYMEMREVHILVRHILVRRKSYDVRAFIGGGTGHTAIRGGG